MSLFYTLLSLDFELFTYFPQLCDVLSFVFLEVGMACRLCMLDCLLKIPRKFSAPLINRLKTREAYTIIQSDSITFFDGWRNDLLAFYSGLAYPTAQSEVGSVRKSPFPENEDENWGTITNHKFKTCLLCKDSKHLIFMNGWNAWNWILELPKGKSITQNLKPLKKSFRSTNWLKGNTTRAYGSIIRLSQIPYGPNLGIVWD